MLYFDQFNTLTEQANCDCDGISVSCADCIAANTVKPFTVIAPFQFFSIAPENIAATDIAIRAIASAILNIEINHSLSEIIANTYQSKAFYVNAPDISPYRDGFINCAECSIPEYLADISLNADTASAEATCLILQAIAGDTLLLCIPVLN